MGLLTNPSLSKMEGGITEKLSNHKRKICFLLYLASLVWFCCLGLPQVNHQTYLSENALSPGLVYTEITRDSEKLARQFMEELVHERTIHKQMPMTWILAKMKQIGLETHTHNYTLNYPFSGGRVFTGTNVYGILRAPRIGSTEGIVFSAPYRNTDSVNPEISASIPILLAFAEAARKKNYWAKDFIFLITDNEQLGIRAWLEAYHTGGLNDEDSILKCGNLPARSGILQAALNLEIQDFEMDYLNVKIEGLNGQLPNLDYVNLIQRITSHERIPCGYKKSVNRNTQRSFTKHPVETNVRNILSMILTQANGVPTGNHGLFHQYRIEALTIEGIKSKSGRQKNSLMPFLKTLEGISRSLNNLLEKFHQSFFFYIMVKPDRFISIGDYMPCAALFISVFFIKSFLMWHELNRRLDKYNESLDQEKEKEQRPEDAISYSYWNTLSTFISVFFFSIFIDFICKNAYISEYSFRNFRFSTETTIGCLMYIISLMGCFFPMFFRLELIDLKVLQIGIQLMIACVLLVINLLNFSLGFLIGVVITPLGIFFEVGGGKAQKVFNGVSLFLCHPFFVTFFFSVALAQGTFGDLDFFGLLDKGFVAFSNVATYGLVDSMVYNNWLFFVVVGFIYPVWLLLYVAASKDLTLNPTNDKLYST